MASSVTLSSQIPIQSSSTTAQTKTFLTRCVEDLSPDKVKGFEKIATRWCIVSAVSVVAFFALAIGAFIATSVLASTYMPAAAIGAILLAIPAVQQIQKFQKWSEEATDEAQKYKRIQHHYADLTKQTPQQLQHLLAQMRILLRPENLTRLTPLLAQVKYQEEQTQHWIGLRDKNANDAKTTEAQQQKTGLHYLALQYEELALHAKIKNAFAQAVLRNPDFRGSFEDVATLSKNTYNDSVLANALNDYSTASELLSFKRGNLSPVSFSDVKTMSVDQLSQRMFASMTAAA